MVVSCNRNVVEKIFAVVVLIVFPAGKSVALMFGRGEEGCFIECCADLVLSRADHGTIHAVNKSYGKLCFFSRREFNIVFCKHVPRAGLVVYGDITAGPRRMLIHIYFV